MAERVAEIYSLLVPLVDGRLIIPRACVAEVVGFQTPSEMTGAPPWYIGTIPWNGKAVPLVSFEGACGQMIPPASGRTRVVILHALGTQIEGGNFAVVSQGFPQLVRVSSDVVRPDNSRSFPERAPGHLPDPHGERDAAGARPAAPGRDDRGRDQHRDDLKESPSTRLLLAPPGPQGPCPLRTHGLIQTLPLI